MNTFVIIMFFAVIIIGLALLIVIALTRRGGSMLNQDRYRSEWLHITQAVADDPSSWQFAILRADKLLDKALRERGVNGENMGDRLKNAKPYVTNLDRVWSMHKVRNRIAHETNVNVSKRQAGEALKVYKRALTDLGAL